MSAFTSLSDILVETRDGATQLSLTFGAHSAARLLVNASTLALLIDIDVWNGMPKLAAIELIVTIDALGFSVFW